MLKNVINSYSFFYQNFIKSCQSQDRQGFSLKAASKKNRQIIFKKLGFKHHDGIQIRSFSA